MARRQTRGVGGGDGGGGGGGGGGGPFNPHVYANHPNELVRKLVEHIGELDRCKETLRREKDELRRAATEAETRMSRAVRDKEEADRQRDTANAEREDARKLARNTQLQLDASRRENNRIQRRSEQERQDHEAAITTMKGQHQQLQSALEQQEESIRQLQEIVYQLENTIALQGAQLKYQAETLSQKEQELEELHKQKKRILQQIRELDTQLDRTSHSRDWWPESGPPVDKACDLVVNNSLVYCRQADSQKIHRLDTVTNQWSVLPVECTQEHTTLGVFKHCLVTVGGEIERKSTNRIESYDEQACCWTNSVPPMPTARSHALLVSTESSLVVAGGNCKRRFTQRKLTDTVEILRVESLEWCAVTGVPAPLSRETHTATLCCDRLYLFPTTLTRSCDCSTCHVTTSRPCYQTQLLVESAPISTEQPLSPVMELPDPGGMVSACYVFDKTVFIIVKVTAISQTMVYQYDDRYHRWQVVDSAVPGDHGSLTVVAAGVVHNSKLMLVLTASGQRTKVATKRLTPCQRKTYFEASEQK